MRTLVLVGLFILLSFSLSCGKESNTQKPDEIVYTPSIPKPNTWDFEPPKVDFSIQGHRGAKAIYPENTIPSFEYAISVKADQIEFDTQYTKDNEMVVFHDPEITARTCTHKNGAKLKKKYSIRKLTVKQIKEFDCGSIRKKKVPKYLAPGEKIPTLDEFLQYVLLSSKQPHAALVVFKWDVKSNPKKPEFYPDSKTIARMIYEAAKKYDIRKRSVFSSFDVEVLRELKKIDESLKTALLVDTALTKKVVESAEELGVNTVSPHYLALFLQGARKWTERFQNVGIHMVPFTVNKESLWKKFLGAGVYGILTDEPERLRKYYNELKEEYGGQIPLIADAEIPDLTEEEINQLIKKAMEEEGL